MEKQTERTVLHCDLNGFFASVECLLHPELRCVPMAVCGDPDSRHGIVLAKNELAKGFGVATAETIWQAQKKCPALVLAPAHHAEYERYSALVRKVYERYTDLVEPFGIDESWLDVTNTMHLFGNGESIANAIRHAVRQELGLTVSVGVSFNKIYAKLGSDYKKPDATTVISRRNYRQIVFPLPVTDLLFVGKAAAQTLSVLGVRTIGDLARADERLLRDRLGKMGELLHAYAAGEDESPVRSVYDVPEVKSVGNSITFRRNLVGLEDIKVGLAMLSDSVACRLRECALDCRCVQVVIRDPNFHNLSRQKALQQPTHLAREMRDVALELICASWNLSAPIRMLGLTGTNLTEIGAGEQLSLFDAKDGAKRKQLDKLENTVDTLRTRYGKSAISTAAVIKSDFTPKKAKPKKEEN